MDRIIKIFWKRTYLFVEIHSEKMPEILLKKGEKEVPFEVKELEDNCFRGKLNLCIAEGRKMLSEGIWDLVINASSFCAVDNIVLDNIETLANVYRYDGDKAYVVTFHLESREDEKISVKLNVDYMMRNPHPEKRKDKLFVLKKGLNWLYKSIRFFASKKGNRILFMSENKAEITGNLKDIYDRMLERGLDKSYRIQLSFRNIFIQRQNPLEWARTVFKIATNDYIFVEDYVPILGFLDIDSKTTIVQTWHAGFGFKSVGYGRFGLEGSPNPFQSCHRKYTYGLVGNDFLKEIYSEVWGIDKDSLLSTGMPRLSNFLNEERKAAIINKTYEEMPFLKGKKVVTFAPTYRGSNQKDAYYDIDRIDQKRLYEFCKENDTVFLMKFHPFLAGKAYVNPSYEECLIDVSKYNLNDLFYVTDILITDYSSCFYDFLLMNKPILFYVYDEEIYSATRGVHRPVSKVAPGVICKTFDELFDALGKQEHEKKNVPDFMIDKCLIDREMTASDKVIDYIILGKRDFKI